MKESLYGFLNRRLSQLKTRKFMIPRYCDQTINWMGKNHYTMDMIPGIQKQIDETEAAIKGIKEWKKNKTN